MKQVDLLVAWSWLPDEPFVRHLAAAAHHHGLSCWLVDPSTVGSVTADVEHGRMRFRWLLDRASDEHPAFGPLAAWTESHAGPDGTGPAAINPHRRLPRAADKATMHLEFLSAGLHVPNTIILPPYSEDPSFAPTDTQLDSLGRPFVVKPANTTGGGNGVCTGVRTREEIQTARRSHPADKYLVQETIRPAYLGDFRAWFRVFFVTGSVHLSWWDDRTHTYDPVDPEDERFFGLGELRKLATAIAEISGLRFFSTELAMTADQRIVAVDYVNETCDLRPQSVVRNGVPDALLLTISEDIVRFIGSPVSSQGVIP